MSSPDSYKTSKWNYLFLLLVPFLIYLGRQNHKDFVSGVENGRIILVGKGEIINKKESKYRSTYLIRIQSSHEEIKAIDNNFIGDVGDVLYVYRDIKYNNIHLTEEKVSILPK